MIVVIAGILYLTTFDLLLVVKKLYYGFSRKSREEYHSASKGGDIILH